MTELREITPDPNVSAHPDRPKLATILFDESHSEAWTVRRELAAEIQPAHPADSSLARAAALLEQREFEVAIHSEGPLGADALSPVATLVIAHPSDPRWEATLAGDPRFSAEEIDAIEAFVFAGGGLIVLGETEQEKYGNNVNELTERFGIRVQNATVQDYENHHGDAPSWVLADLASEPRNEDYGPDPLARVSAACFYRAGTLGVEPEPASGRSTTPGGGQSSEHRSEPRVLARTHATASPPNAPLLAVAGHGKGRVAVLADSDLFGDDCIEDLSHSALWLNLVYWTSQPAFERADDAGASEIASDPAWIRLKAATEELRLTQAKDGSVDTSEHNADTLRNLTMAIAESAQALKPHFPHQHDYIDALAVDLIAWSDGGYGKPGFMRSLEAFRPEQQRQDGIEHLVVFPMYKQNASRDVCFEALLINVPWPEWIAALERDRYDNAKFLPVTFVDRTSGYDSECAVLFPETFSTAEKPAEFHFGAIFCDREAERFRRVCGAAAETLRLNLPPDAACLLASPELSRQAFMLWDLIHDRTHMRGDLPFDPFMIRQRSPYWMYSLEELRCDLTAFGEAVKLENEGFAFARHAQYAILFDRLFRFPLTGARIRNYDGLGGQLLFAFLHRGGHIHWTDNRLTVEWERVAGGVGELGERVQALYHSGIDRTKLGQWIAAHDLINEYVPAAERSVWSAAHRDLPDVENKILIDLVGEDEFPLSLFYTQLQPKLKDALAG